MRYRAEIKSIVNPGKTIFIGSDSTANLVLQDLFIIYKYLEYSSPGRLTVTGFVSRGMPLDAVQSGDIIFLYENNVRIYVGYILSTDTSISANKLVQTIQFDTLLSQWLRQMMVSTVSDVLVTIQPDSKESTLNSNFAVGRLRVQQLLDFLIKGSIFEYAKKNYNFNTPQSKFGVIYENAALLNSKTDVYYYPSVGTTKAQVIRLVLYPFQQILYQDPSGNLRFSSPSYSNKSPLQIDRFTSSYISIRLKERQVDVTNYVVSTLLYLGIFPTFTDTDLNVTSISVPNPKYFPQLTNLLNSGFFTQTHVDVRNLGTDLVRDPVLLNVLTNLINNPALNTFLKVPVNGSKFKTIAPLFSNRILAEALTGARSVVIDLPRTPAYTDIPIGKVFQAVGTSWICTSATLSLSISDDGGVSNTIQIVGAPLSTCTGVWIP